MYVRGIISTLFLVLSGIALNSCGFHIVATDENGGNFISGIVKPFVGSIVEQHPAQQLFISRSYASLCSDPVYAKLYELQADGTIKVDQPLESQLLGADARYRFDLSKIPVTETATVNYLVVADGCDGSVFKRPVTNFDDQQDLDAKTTIVSQVVNIDSDIPNKLNQIDRKEIELLIKSIDGDSIATALDSLTNEPALTTQFTQIFGSSPTVILETKPDVTLAVPTAAINELATATFNVQAFHINPNYSFAYSWKLDGVVKSTSGNWNYTPGANAQGAHQVDLYVGMDDGTGNIDISKPYYSKTIALTVNNNIKPIPPEITIAAATPSPRQVNSIDIDLATGIGMADCSSFTSLAFTETSAAPAPSAFNISCSAAGTQTETVFFSSADGVKNLYLWAMDSKGEISTSRSLSFIKDGTAPIASITFPSSLLRGGTSKAITVQISDATSGVASAVLEFAANGTSFSHLANLTAGQTSYNWSVPAIDTAAAKLRLTVTDNAGLITEFVSSAFTIDSTPPLAPSFAIFSANPTSSSVVQISVSSCSDVQEILLTELNLAPTGLESDWQSCSTLAGAHGITITGDGTHNLYLWSRDAAGIISTSAQTQSLVLDTTQPVIATAPSLGAPVVKSQSTQNISWTVTDTTIATINLSYSTNGGTNWNTIVASTANDGAYSWNLPLTDAEALIKLQATDELGFTSESTSSFIIDGIGPVASSIAINSGATSTGNRNVLINMSGVDNHSNVQAFCLKYNNSTIPLDNDECWIELTAIGSAPDASFSLSNFPYQIGSIQGDYAVSLWFQDSLGNITETENTATISYYPDPAPVISNFIASSTDTPANPLTIADTTVPFNYDLFIRWSLTDDKPIPAGNISLYYTTNDNNYIEIASNLENAANGACTLTAETTGCFKWSVSSPTDAYYRIKLLVTDSGGTTIFEVSNPLNTGSVKFLSGNTSLGIGGAATNAVLLGYGEAVYNDNHDTQALVVTKTGYIFYRYYNRGLVYISPTDGILRDVAFQTGASTGDGGSVFNATFKSMRRMILDYDDNVLIWDDNRVRKIDTTSWTITTVFGGGADSSDGASALAANIGAGYSDQFTATPDGRIYFNKSNQIWYYDPTDSLVKHKITLTGLGTGDMAGWRANLDNAVCQGTNAAFAFNKTTSAWTKVMRRMSGSAAAACGSLTSTAPYYNTSFDPVTGVAQAPHPTDTSWSSHKFTGMDGNIYVLSQGRATLTRYNPATNTFDKVVGLGSNGRCADGTPALSCRVVVMSAFVSEFGKVYFIDLGVLRTIDSAGNVQTIAGQPRNFGIGYNPVSARYSKIDFFDLNGDDVYIRNELENQIVKFSLNGGVLQHIAGNTVRGGTSMGVDATTSALPNCSWSMPCSFIVDATNNRLYHYAGAGGQINYIDLTTGKWVGQASGLQDTAARVSYIGINPQGLLTYLPSHYGVSGNKVTLRVFDQVNNLSTRIYGKDSVEVSLSSTICTGVDGTTCTLAHTMTDAVQERFKYDASTGNWLITIRGSNSLYTIPSLGGTVNLFETMNNGFVSYDFYKGATEDFVFYCSTSGNLYKRNITTNVETALTLPISSMKCSSGSLFYHSARNSLIFAYQQNGLYGIAEYLNP